MPLKSPRCADFSSLGALASGRGEAIAVLVIFVAVAIQSVNAAFKFRKELRPPDHKVDI
jgi:hypothetical protein